LNRSTWTLLVVLCFAVIGWTAAGLSWAQTEKKKDNWKDTEAGVVPLEYGDLIAVTGQTGNLTLIFKNSENNLAILQMQGNKINPQMSIIKRKY
jgi:hypothetical protein